MTHNTRVYPHTRHLNLAHYQLETINNKVSINNEDALTLDCQACLTSLAFTVEALINFIGHKKVENWVERRPFPKKLRQVCAVANIDFNLGIEPLQRIDLIQEIRNLMAHGQPIESNEVIGSQEELRLALACPWDRYANPDFVNETYQAVKQFQVLLLSGCEISIGETLTSARR